MMDPDESLDNYTIIDLTGLGNHCDAKVTIGPRDRYASLSEEGRFKSLAPDRATSSDRNRSRPKQTQCP